MTVAFYCVLMSTEVNECSEFPCDPFGDCVDLVNDYTCLCRPGFNETDSTKYCEGTTVRNYIVSQITSQLLQALVSTSMD